MVITPARFAHDAAAQSSDYPFAQEYKPRTSRARDCLGSTSDCLRCNFGGSIQGVPTDPIGLDSLEAFRGLFNIREISKLPLANSLASSWLNTPVSPA